MVGGGSHCEHCDHHAPHHDHHSGHGIHHHEQHSSHSGHLAPAQHYGPVPPAQHYGPVPPAQHYGPVPPAQHYGPGAPAQHYGPVEPEGELVTVFTEANPNYRLTVRNDGVVLAFKNSRDINQQWIKVDMGAGKGEFFDREGQPGFLLVNKSTGLPLKHGHQSNDVVTTHHQVYGTSHLEGSIIWSFGKKDEGKGYRALRPVTNISLNLDAEHADRGHGGVRDGNRLLISNWKPQENFHWKIEPFEHTGEESVSHHHA